MAADDIVTRLRTLADPDVHGYSFGPIGLLVDAADEIERLRAVVGELSEALINTPCGCPGKCRCGRDAALAVWQEARRG